MIDVARLESICTVSIGSHGSPLHVGDTIEDVTVIAEGFQMDGTPISPAPFASDSGGWAAEVVMEDVSGISLTVANPLYDDGTIILRLALNESLNKAGQHRGSVRVFNPIAARTRQRTVFDFVVTVSEIPV